MAESAALRPEVALPLLVAGALYALGWRRLARRHPGPAPWPRLALAFAGLVSIAVALVSPLDALAEKWFVAHMVQHMLLIMVAAPALLLADPYPIVLWALPRGLRCRAGRWLGRASLFGRLWRAATAAPLAWVAYAGTLWAWHLPSAYDAALSDPLIHDVEHLAFFLSAVLFWWPVIDPAPRFRRPVPYALRIVYLVLAAFQTAALGLLLTLAPVPLYRSYAGAPAPGALDALEDQAWGGIVMWGGGGLVEMLAVLVLLHRSLGAEARESATVPGVMAPAPAAMPRDRASRAR